MGDQRRRGGPSGLLLVALLGLVLGVAACGRGDDQNAGDVRMALAIVPESPSVEPVTLALTVNTTDGEPVSGAELQAEGNMNHAGMEPVFAELIEQEPGVYQSEGFAFTMGGDWIITITGELADGEPVSETFDVSVTE